MERGKKWIVGATVSLALAGCAFLSTQARADNAGATTFKTKCAVCHGADGKGETSIGKADKIRDLGSAEVQKQSNEDLSEIIEKGKGKMPAYGKSLKPEQIKDLVAFLRTLKK